MYDSWIDELKSDLEGLVSTHQIDQVKSKYLGKDGIVSNAMKGLLRRHSNSALKLAQT